MSANWTLLWIHECSLIQLFFLAFVLWRQSLLPGCYFFLIQPRWPGVSMAVGASRVWCSASSTSGSPTVEELLLWLGREHPHEESCGGITQWGLFSAAALAAGQGLSQPSLRARLQGASPENAKTSHFCSVSLAKSSLSPPATPQQGELKDSTELFLLSPPRCPVLSQCPHHRATKGGDICTSNIHLPWGILKLPLLWVINGRHHTGFLRE